MQHRTSRLPALGRGSDHRRRTHQSIPHNPHSVQSRGLSRIEPDRCLVVPQPGPPVGAEGSRASADGPVPILVTGLIMPADQRPGRCRETGAVHGSSRQRRHPRHPAAVRGRWRVPLIGVGASPVGSSGARGGGHHHLRSPRHAPSAVFRHIGGPTPPRRLPASHLGALFDTVALATALRPRSFAPTKVAVPAIPMAPKTLSALRRLCLPWPGSADSWFTPYIS